MYYMGLLYIFVKSKHTNDLKQGHNLPYKCLMLSDVVVYIYLYIVTLKDKNTVVIIDLNW